MKYLFAKQTQKNDYQPHKKFNLFVLILFCLSSQWVSAQSAQESEAVMTPIRKLFEGMQKGDSALAHSVFAKQVTLAIIGVDKNGKLLQRNEPSVDGFIKSVGTPHAEPWNEVIWDEKILIDGNLAQVGASYAFYLAKKFSHCGVDAFHLVKGDDGNWKIFHLAYSVRKGDCAVPQKISKQFE